MGQTFEAVLRKWNQQAEKDISYRAQFEIERSCADAIRESEPFSEKRREITRLGYEAVDRIITLRTEHDGGRVQAYGANAACFSLLDQIIAHKLLSYPEASFSPIRFFEGGVGTGAVLKHLAEKFGEKLHLAGCDVYLDREHLGDLQNRCAEDTLYHSLENLPDESVDIFYWNDVMEHMPEDEMPALLQLLSRKLSDGGILITVTPPAGIGPHDITCFVDPYAGKAMGLHLHEYYFYEVYEAMKEVNLLPYAFAKRHRDGYEIRYDSAEKRYQRHAAAERFFLKFAYIFKGEFGLFWRRKLMGRFTDATIFTRR